MKNYLPALIVLMVPFLTAIVHLIVARLSGKANATVDVQASDLTNPPQTVSPNVGRAHAVRHQQREEDDEDDEDDVEVISPLTAVSNLNHRAFFPPEQFPHLYPELSSDLPP